MRPLIVTNMMSLDGQFEGPGKNVMDLFEYRVKEYPEDDSFDRYNLERLRKADTLLLGPTSYQAFMAYWPPIAAEERASPTVREISRRMNDIEKVVISDHMITRSRDPWQTTRIIRRAEAPEEILELKRKKGKDILTFASHIVWNELFEKGLVDELHLIVSPVIVGHGTRIFAGKPPAGLRLLEARTWNGSGTVLLRYRAGRSHA